jgi:hypothetical protein
MPEGLCGARLLRRDRCGAAVPAPRVALCLAGASLSLLAACNLGPRYHRPDIPPPSSWVTTSDAAAPEWPGSEWWRGFQSDDLNSDHYSLLRTLEAGFGLKCLNHACDKTSQVMNELFGG